MKALLKFLLVSLATTIAVRALREMVAAADSRGGHRPVNQDPVRDAEPNIDRPLREEDLRVAQNAPF